MAAPSSNHVFRHPRFSDIRGCAQLATQATSSITHIVEGVHHPVLEAIGIPGAKTTGQPRGDPPDRALADGSSTM